jgi:arabinose-5-phosphate isomerase
MSPEQPRDQRILERGRHFLAEEGRAILARSEALGEPFVRLVRRLLALRGKVGVTGVGKSGLIGEKVAATLSSTGTPALFLKPVDALHGDLGVLATEDYLLAISNSGETTEVLAVVEAARALGIGVSSLTGNPASSLGRASEITIDIGAHREACPLGLAPTTSTTVTLAVGDALALVLLELRGFTEESYARLHPGGALGERLRYRVRDLMRDRRRTPVVSTTDPVAAALREMTERENLGVTLVVDAGGALAGIVTDGDLRRLLLGERGPGAAALQRRVEEVMTRNPKVVDPDAPASTALRVMEVLGITSLAVIDPLSRPIGILHIHDILGRGKILL